MIDKICKSCGTSLSEIYRSGYAGCPDCYRQFGEELKPLLVKIQGSCYHTGSRPSLSAIEKELLGDYGRYCKEREAAVREGRFGDLPKLNKIISDLSEELKRRGLI